MNHDRQESHGFPYQFDPDSDEIRKSVSSVLREIFRRFAQEPLRHHHWFLIKKPVSFWSWNLVQGPDAFVYAVSGSPYFSIKTFQWTHLLMYTLHTGPVIFCLIGCILVWIPFFTSNLPLTTVLSARFVSIFLIYMTGIHMIGAPFPRYSVPLRPLLYGLACLPPI
jgi:hypothetical protein